MISWFIYDIIINLIQSIVNIIVIRFEMSKNNKNDKHSKKNNHQQLSYAQSFSEQLPSYQQINHPIQIHHLYIKSPYISKYNHHQQQQTIKQSPLQPQNPSQRQKRASLYGHKRGKSMDLNEIHTFQIENFHNESKNLNKIIVNNEFITKLNNRNTISEMKDYEPKFKKQSKVKQLKQIKFANKKKSKHDLITNYHNISNKPLSSVFQIYQTKSKHFKNNKLKKQLSKALSMKIQDKNDKKNHQIITQRRCKSSLKEKYNSKIINEVKSTEKDIPLISKLNSLYSNTTSIYNSYSELQQIKQNQSFRIPTQETLQINQIRKYQSQILTNETKTRNLRQYHPKNVVQGLNEDYFEKVNHTKQLINHYISVFSSQGLRYPNPSLNQSQEFVEINQPKSYQHMYQIYQNHHFPSKNQIPSDNHLQSYDGIQLKHTISKQLIKKIQSETLMGLESNQSKQNLDKMIKLIKEKQYLEMSDKNKIISTIKELLEKERDAFKKHEQEIQQKNNICLQDSSNLNSLSMKQSTQSQIDINMLNLQLLDNTLKKRQIILKQQMQRQISKIEQSHAKEQSINQERSKIKKWFQYEIKEVHKIRNQLWIGFNNAKRLVYENIVGRNFDIIESKSQKYLKKTRGKVHKRDSERQNRHKNKDQNLQYKSQSKKQLPTDQFPPLQQNYQSHRKDTNQSYQSPEIMVNGKILIDLVSSNKQQLYYNSNSNEKSLNSFQISDSAVKQIDFSNDSQQKEKSPILNRSDNIKFDDLLLIRNDDLINLQERKQISQLTLEDKQSIFEFIFLDLCLQITQEYRYNHKILLKIHDFIKRIQEQSKKVKGFKTNSNYIRQYLYQFMNFLKKNSSLLVEIHANMDESVGPSQLELLKYINQYESNSNYLPPQVLSIHLFDIFQTTYLKSIKFQIFYDVDQQKEAKRQSFLKNMIHVHNKALFDSLNQELDKNRIYGPMGKPFLWKKTSKFNHNRTTKQKNEIIVRCCQKLIENSTIMCGFMVDKEDCPLKNNKNITLQYIQQLRSDRLFRLLTAELEQMQQKMQFMDDQQAEFLVTLANIIFQFIILQAINEINKFS